MLIGSTSLNSHRGAETTEAVPPNRTQRCDWVDPKFGKWQSLLDLIPEHPSNTGNAGPKQAALAQTYLTQDYLTQ
ncbi:MAG: hypothetical protein ACI9FZ_000584 [Bacteroidia bacterium]|jgi:hypothetical protein